MSINICPSDWYNIEPNLLSLSGLSISLKLKYIGHGLRVAFYLYGESPKVIKLSKPLEFFTTVDTNYLEHSEFHLNLIHELLKFEKSLRQNLARTMK